MKKFSGRLALQQRVLPFYRVPFFETLAAACEGGLSLFAGEPRPEENIVTAKSLRNAEYELARNRHILHGSFYFCYQSGLLDWLEKYDPHALVLEANPRNVASFAAIKRMHARGRPVIGWGLGAPSRGDSLGFASLQKQSWARFLKRFDALIAYSRRGAAEYASYGIPAERIFVAHNAVASPPSDKMPSRLAEKKPNEPFYLLFVGRLQERKKLDHLLRACASLPMQTELWIVGEGAIRPKLTQLASEIFPSTRFFGEMHGEALKEIWAAADLFVLPGTGGLAVQEAMAHALPVIVAKGDGTQDDLVRPQNGWQIPADDLDALTATLAEALSDLSRLRRMGAESWRIVREEVNIEKMTEVFLQVLQEFL
jgi:glycosyltransferase involved in cell wall biosynthesis